MSRLFIAEKPSMGRAIAQGLEALGKIRQRDHAQLALEAVRGADDGDN